MLWRLERWYNERKARKTRQEYCNGYDWAAGALLRGEETPMSIESYTYLQERSPFDQGADDAVDLLVKFDVVEDNRINFITQRR